MFALRYRLSTKIVGILVLYFIVAAAAIWMTLQLSTDFEGGAAAINETGSQRMRTYRLVALALRDGGDAAAAPEPAASFDRERARFEAVLDELARGNPSRPLFLPQDAEVRAALDALRWQWRQTVQPQLMALRALPTAAARVQAAKALAPVIDAFVAQIDALVVDVERKNARNTSLLRTFQLGLLLLALVGTSILILWFHAVVLRPIGALHEGIGRMSEGDFGQRVPVEQRDELGELADGFNHMADELSGIYATLAERVEERTRSLEERNGELTLLYEIAAFLNEPATTEALCQGFLDRAIAAVGADGGVVRLVDAATDSVRLTVSAGLSADFVAGEATLGCGECVCGAVADDGGTALIDLDRPGFGVVRPDCRAEGFRQVVVFPIQHQKQRVGVFSLYSRWPREYVEREVRLLETLGQHLGLAIENLRLVSREKAMAVSEERNVLAQELHDSIAQSLAFLNIQAQLLDASLKRGDVGEAREGLAPMREGIQESYDHVRELLAHFRTRLTPGGLEEALRGTLQRFEGQTGIVTALTCDGASAASLQSHALDILHIVQEALSNTRKHAGARHVAVDLACRDGRYCVTVRDDGDGFDVRAAATREGHMGLQIMRERAHRIGGTLAVRSTAEGVAGTEIRLVSELPEGTCAS